MNLNNENKPNYYAIIPAYVRYDNSLKAIEKLMYGEITALTDKIGNVKKIDKYKQCLILNDKRIIPMNEIIEIRM